MVHAVIESPGAWKEYKVQFIYFANFINTKKIHLQPKCTIQVERKKKKRQTVNHLQKSNLTTLLLQIVCK